MSQNNSLIPTQHELQSIEVICRYATESTYFKALGGMPGVMCIALYAREIGVPIMTALMGGFSNVSGKITMSAELMHSLMRAAGMRINIIHNDSNECEIHGKRSDTGDEYTAIYTIEDARKANLIKSGGAWEKNPSDMLFARCISRLRRRLAPDIATKAFVEGELEDDNDTKQNLSESTKTTDKTVEAMNQFMEKFKPIENADFTLNKFLDFYCTQYKKEPKDAIRAAMKTPEKFSKAYVDWVEKSKPVEAVVEVQSEKPKQMELIS